MKILLPVVVTACMATTCLGSTRPCNVPKDEMQVVTSYLEWATDSKDSTVLVTRTEASKIDVDFVNLHFAIGDHGVPVDVRNGNDLKRKNGSNLFSWREQRSPPPIPSSSSCPAHLRAA